MHGSDERYSLERFQRQWLPAIPKPRAEWIAKRRAANTDGNFSQMRYARRGVITEEMEFIAYKEKQPRGI